MLAMLEVASRWLVQPHERPFGLLFGVPLPPIKLFGAERLIETPRDIPVSERPASSDSCCSVTLSRLAAVCHRSTRAPRSRTDDLEHHGVIMMFVPTADLGLATLWRSW